MLNQLKKILVVEDDQLLRKVLVEEFTKQGFEALVAGDGQEGLSVALNESPDLILLDIIMPVKDGLTMLKELRQSEKGRSVPVIVLTNLSDAGMVDESLRSGIYDFLIKADWELADIVRKVKEKLRVN